MNALVFFFAVAALLWGLWFALRGSLLAGAVVYLVLVCCAGEHLTQFELGPVHVSLDRLFLLGLIGQYVVQRWSGGTRPKQLGLGDVFLGGFFGLLLWGTFTSDWQTASPRVSPVLPHLVNGYLIPLVLFWICRQSALTAKNVRLAHLLLVGFGGYLAVTGLLEVAGAWGLVFPRYIADPSLGIHFGRARGPMLQSGTFGMYLVISVAATWLLLAWRGPLGRTGRLLAVALLPLYGATIYFTQTRSVWMSAGLAAVVLVMFSFRGAWRPIAIGALVVAAVGIVAVKGEQLIGFKRDALSVSDTRESTYMRAKFAYVSWSMFRDRPLQGHGFGQFPEENRRYLSDHSTPMRLETIRGYINHNTYLSLLVDLGLLGLALFLGLIAFWIREAWRLWRDADHPDWVRAHGLLTLVALVPYLCQMMFREVSYSPMENAIIFCLAGITVGLAGSEAAWTEVARERAGLGEPRRVVTVRRASHPRSGVASGISV